MVRIILSFILLFIAAALNAQKIIGTVIDYETGEALIGASVIIKGTTQGSVTDFDGNFEIQYSKEFPVTLVIMFMGYEQQELIVNSGKDNIKLKLKPDAIKLADVEIVGSRISEKQKESALTVEAMDVLAIKETPAISFYEGLGAMKGVDLTTASLGFTIVNTRGFNSTSPVRTLQIIDKVDNQSPGLNFSLGNFLGASEIDLQSTELIVGASGAMFGPNAFNGVIKMDTKSPFVHPGLTIKVRGAERQMFETSIRYAKVFTSKEGKQKFAFKFNGFFMRAYDWEAVNYDSTSQSQVDSLNPGGYDAVNVYGDENITTSTNNFTSEYGKRTYPGLGIYHRTGYQESDLVNYNTNNVKLNGALCYKITEEIEADYCYFIGTGTTIYQGDNRYSLKGIKFQQHKVSIKKPGKFYILGYTTYEDAGRSYDAVLTSQLLQEASKSDGDWSNDYNSYWLKYVEDKVWDLPGFPKQDINWFNENKEATYATADSILLVYHDSLVKWHAEAGDYANGVGNSSLNQARFVPGTAAFDSAFNAITSTPISEGGSMLVDKSGLIHVQGEYKFTPSFATISVGSSFRQYRPNSEGSIFSDTNGVKIINNAMGLFVNIEKRLFEEKLILNVANRVDKNQNFDYLFSPAASAVYKLKDKHYFRASFSSALRNPTLLDQYLYYNVGSAILIGNLTGMDSVITIDNLYDYYDGLDPSVIDYLTIDPIKPEKVKSIEFGYKGTMFKDFFVDASYYYSWYWDFIGYKLISSNPVDNKTSLPKAFTIYRIAANANDMVTTQGFSIGLNYYIGKFYAVNGNYSWNRLDKKGSDDPIIPAFNTPEHKFNIGLNGRDIAKDIEVLNKISDKLPVIKIRNTGFNVNYKWIQGFLFEGSPQFTGYVPTYSLLDAQVNYTIKRFNTTFKVGASNLLNNMKFQTYGGPYIGRMAYLGIITEIR